MNEKEKFLATEINEEILKLSSNTDKRRKYVRKIITDDLLKFLYQSNITANGIADIINNKSIYFKASAGNLIRRLKEGGCKVRNFSETYNLPGYQKNKSDTVNRKYGFNHISQVPHIKAMKRKKCIETYGVDNNFKSDIIKQKTRQTLFDKYGVYNAREVSHHPRTCSRISKEQLKINEIINDLGYDTDMEVQNLCRTFNEKLGKIYSPVVDIKLKNFNIVVEVYGDLWHANPNIYKDSDVIYKYKGPTTAKEIREFDAIREEQIKNSGYSLIIIWTSEFRHDKQETREKLKNEIENHKNKQN